MNKLNKYNFINYFYRIKHEHDVCLSYTHHFLLKNSLGEECLLNTVHGCLRLCEDGRLSVEMTEIRVLESRREAGGVERAWRVGASREEEMRRGRGGVEGRASQVSTFLSIFHQAG